MNPNNSHQNGEENQGEERRNRGVQNVDGDQGQQGPGQQAQQENGPPLVQVIGENVLVAGIAATAAGGTALATAPAGPVVQAALSTAAGAGAGAAAEHALQNPAPEHKMQPTQPPPASPPQQDDANVVEGSDTVAIARRRRTDRVRQRRRRRRLRRLRRRRRYFFRFGLRPHLRRGHRSSRRR